MTDTAGSGHTLPAARGEEPARPPLEISLRVDAAATPISGHLGACGVERAFSGWMELLTALDAAVDRRPSGTDGSDLGAFHQPESRS